jgi:hypothetical protein
MASEDSRGALTRVMIEYTRLSLEKWRLEKAWMLWRIEG